MSKVTTTRGADKDHAPFLADCLANPTDQAPRLIYADWLESQGNPRGTNLRTLLTWLKEVASWPVAFDQAYLNCELYWSYAQKTGEVMREGQTRAVGVAFLRYMPMAVRPLFEAIPRLGDQHGVLQSGLVAMELMATGLLDSKGVAPQRKLAWSFWNGCRRITIGGQWGAKAIWMGLWQEGHLDLMQLARCCRRSSQAEQPLVNNWMWQVYLNQPKFIH